MYVYIYTYYISYHIFFNSSYMCIAGVRTLEESCRSFQWGRGTPNAGPNEARPMRRCAVENNEDMTARFLGDRSDRLIFT